MCKLMEDYGEKIRVRSWAEGKAEGRTEGRTEGAKKIALKMWNGGMRDLQQIANFTELSVDEIKKLIEDNSL